MEIKLASYDQSLNLTRRVPYTDPHSHFRKRTLFGVAANQLRAIWTDERRTEAQAVQCGGGGNNTRTMTGHFIRLCPLRQTTLADYIH